MPRVLGHRDVNLTTCPGDLMFSKLSSVRSTATSTYTAGVSATSSEAATTSVVETYTRPSGTSFALSGLPLRPRRHEPMGADALTQRPDQR